MDLKRRGFLKLFSAVPVIAVVAPHVLSIEAKAPSYARATPTALGGTMSKIHWKDIIAVPESFSPTRHAHTLDDIYGGMSLQEAIAAIDLKGVTLPS